MCGIFGLFSIDKKLDIDLKRASEAMLTMKHRGPDASGYKFFGNNAYLGHLRLSIIDLNPCSNQPFVIDNRYWITYNGEIYNYLEIKEELISQFFVNFTTESDTEVLLRAYQYWGESCVKRFNGMWAFAIYDTEEETLFCSRDRYGVKPFNYAIYDNVFIFASEIKAIISYYTELKIPNYNVIANFCRTSTGAQICETWFENIFRLAPGSNLLIKNGEINCYKYWNYPVEINKDITFDDALEKYKSIFIDAVKIRMRSDVPVGTTLSSGLDSGSIVSVLRTFDNNPHFTFTAKFDETKFENAEKQVYATNDLEINEAAIVEKEAKILGLTSSIIEIEYGDFVNDLRHIIHYLESGNSSPATFPLMQVMERAKKDVTVVLEGQGADELLLGYLNPNFFSILILLLKKIEIRKAYKFYKSFKSVYSVKYAVALYMRGLLNTNSLFRCIYSFFNKKENLYDLNLKSYRFIKDYPDLNSNSEDPINTLLIKQHSGGLVNLLHYGDAVSMAHSIESRLPFMDYRLVEFAFSLPWHYKVTNNLTKYIHRKAMEGIVPDFIVNNPIKFGFNSPLSDKFAYSKTTISDAVSILLSDRCIDRKLFKYVELEKLIIEQNNGTKNHSTLLFRLLSVELWFREFIDEQ